MSNDLMEDSGSEAKPIMSPDTRKRPLEGENEDGVSKKSHYIPDLPSEGTFHMKILIPSIVAGAIIGKGGETIAKLQKESNARVKMSKANDFYPGTTERVCLISGSVEAIVEVLSFVIEKIKEKPDHKPGDHDKQGSDRDKQVKILVPNSTAGMIIGKGGAYIKQIKEESGAYVQISQKAKDQSLVERCITIISNDLDNCQSACMMILTKIAEDPQSGTCLNVSYSDVTGPVANPNPTGSPFAHTPFSQGIGGSFSNPLSAVNGLGSLLGGGVNLTLNLSSAFPGGGMGNPAVTSQLCDHVRTQLRGCGFNDQGINEVCLAISTLINYGIIGLSLGLGPNVHQGQQAGGPMSLGPPPLLGNSPGAGNAGPFGPIGTTLSSGISVGPGRGDRFGNDGVMEGFGKHAAAQSALNSNSFGLGTDTKSDGPDSKKEVEVGEHIVGAIIGPGGKNLIEIQRISGTTIQISKKGNYAPGTKNRVVTIQGSPTGISSAQYLIEQNVNEEEAKRARHASMMANMG